MGKGASQGQRANFEMTSPISIFEKGQLICPRIFSTYKVVLEGRASMSQ